MSEVIKPECPNCHKIIPFRNPNFCSFCGYELDEETKKKYTRPSCPPEIQQGHCEECKTGQYKQCDDCGSKKEVEYRPQFERKCLCWTCRQREATILARSRSW